MTNLGVSVSKGLLEDRNCLQDPPSGSVEGEAPVRQAAGFGREEFGGKAARRSR